MNASYYIYHESGEEQFFSGVNEALLYQLEHYNLFVIPEGKLLRDLIIVHVASIKELGRYDVFLQYNVKSGKVRPIVLYDIPSIIEEAREDEIGTTDAKPARNVAARITEI